jgi:hypothetical protein
MDRRAGGTASNFLFSVMRGLIGHPDDFNVTGFPPPRE